MFFLICSARIFKIYFLRNFTYIILFIINSGISEVVKYPPTNAGNSKDTGSIPGLEQFLGVKMANPFQYTCLENFMDRGG